MQAHCVCPHGDTEGPRAQAAPLELAEGPGMGMGVGGPQPCLPRARRPARPGAGLSQRFSADGFSFSLRSDNPRPG